MQSINRTLQRLQNSSSFKQNYEQLKTDVLSNVHVQQFLKENSDDLTNDIIEKNMMKLYEFTTQSLGCDKCHGVESCCNTLAGYEPTLYLNGEMIEVRYRPCPTKVVNDERKRLERLIKSMYVPKEILRASFADYQLDTVGRMDAFEYAEKFSSSYESDEKMKGLYLHGEFGVGKSYLLGAIANQLADKGIPSLLVYVPEFLREMKQSLGDQSLNEKLERVKRSPILMLDDIGAETMSSWTRDEVMGSILQFRMQEQLPTFFSSNFDFNQLEHHLTYSQRGEEEKMKAARIMERIKYLAKPILLDGPNRRHS